MSKRTLKTTLAIAFIALTSTAIASPALANAGHNNIAGPSVTDAGTVSPQASNGVRPCYTEPSGFHNSIHWDNACSVARKTERTMGDRVESAQPKFVEPDGFHKNIRFNK